MGAKVSRTDFEWVYTEEPHATRRKLILDKHPEVKQLFGHDPNFKWMVTALVVVQILSLPYVAQLSWPVLLLTAYCFGGTINHSLMLAMHEISHNMALGHARPTANRWFGMFATLPFGVPASISFRKYHKEHHKFLAQDGLDPDLPTLVEAKLFNTTLGKVAWIALMPMFYLFRPMVVRPLPIEPLEVANAIVQLFFDAVIVQLYGWKVLVYLISGTIMSLGLHPMAAHLITEHYMFEKGFETYSYYGPWNWLLFNGGYHMEHHDFPAIPFTRLPKLRRIAAEFYDDLPYHKTWLTVFYDFVMDPAIGPYARIKRRQHGLKS